MGGIFLAFSDFLMGSLDTSGEPCGSNVMKQINVDVIGSIFIDLFMLLVPVSLALPIAAHYAAPGKAPLAWLASAAAIYCLGCFLVTGMGNVPMNNTLAAATGAKQSAYWHETYLSRWTALNTVRTCACLAASAAYLVALVLLAETSSSASKTPPAEPTDTSLLMTERP